MFTTTTPEQTSERTLASAVESTIAWRLRIETRVEHQAIEQNCRLRRLSEPDLEIEEYVSILRRLLAYVGPVEDDLRRWSQHLPHSLELASRLTKAELLRRDIATLSRSGDLEANLSVVAPSPGLSSVEQAWGCLYLFEGATMGGQILARCLQSNLGLTPDHGTAFYSSYRHLTGARWQTFKAALNASVVEEALFADEIVATAQATFRAMNLWMAGDR